MKAFRFLKFGLLGVSFFSLSVVAQSPVEQEMAAQKPVPLSRDALDIAIFKERMEQIHGSRGIPRKGKWRVSFQGNTQEWEWNGAVFTCPEPERWDCSLWVPKAFEWWQTNYAWLESIEEFSKLGFFLDDSETNEKTQSTQKLSLVEGRLTNQLDTQEAEGVEAEPLEPVLIQGKRQASEIWRLKISTGEVVNLHSSLRNQWIDRLDYAGSKEFIIWKRPNRWSRPQIESLVLERGGQRINFQKIEK